MLFQRSLARDVPVLLCVGVAAGLCACAGSGESRSYDVKMLGTAARPAELDRLSAFLGTWASSAEQRDVATGAVTRVDTLSTTRWGPGERFLIQEGTRTTASGATSGYLSITTWDGERGVYRQWSFGDDGSVVAGEDWTYSEKENAWRFTQEINSQRIESVLRFGPGGGTMEMSYSVYGRGASGKVADGRATAQRR